MSQVVSEASQQNPYSVRNACTRKRAFATWEDAEAEILKLRDEHDYMVDGAPLLAYACMYGVHWHMGHSRPKKHRPHKKRP